MVHFPNAATWGGLSTGTIFVVTHARGLNSQPIGIPKTQRSHLSRVCKGQTIKATVPPPLFVYFFFESSAVHLQSYCFYVIFSRTLIIVFILFSKMYSLGMASVVFAATQLALSAPTQLQEYARGEHQDPPLFNEDPLPPPPQPAPTLQSDKRKPFAVKVKQHSNTHMSFKPKPKPKPKPEPEPKRSITPDMETATVSQRDIEDGNDNGESAKHRLQECNS
ncbi:hypothetical protein K439DRAFT_981669 [Ramaria rubella]|nr:hypothetical protein K439DRAFT_981669 [Ramaria rubella]